MSSILIANSNPLHEDVLAELRRKYDAQIVRTPEELINATQEAAFTYIFFPHWSYIIPASIYERFECVLFHMTDLPYGRGGSPLQNLIVRGFTSTKLTAIKVSKGLDTGPIYLQRDLTLTGTAREIFLRAGTIMVEMIEEVIEHRPQPIPQAGEPTLFKRRKPMDSNIGELTELSKVYDFIRMLDSDGYPPAFIETDHLRFEFSRSSLHANKIVADVRITKK